MQVNKRSYRKHFSSGGTNFKHSSCAGQLRNCLLVKNFDCSGQGRDLVFTQGQARNVANVIPRQFSIACGNANTHAQRNVLGFLHNDGPAALGVCCFRYNTKTFFILSVTSSRSKSFSNMKKNGHNNPENLEMWSVRYSWPMS